MKSFAATALAVFFHILGFSVGCGLWLLIGWSLGNLVGAPISGALTGLAWQTGCYFVLHDQMAASLERGRVKFAAVIDRI